MSEDADDPDGAPEGSFEDADDPAAAFEQSTELPGANLRAMEFWDEVVADMEATAAEYEADGWETLQLHPGDVTTRTPDGDDDRFGLDVLVPGDEFEAVEDLLAGEVAFGSYEAFTAMADGLVLLVVAMEDATEQVAVLYPAYYDAEDASEMLEAAERAGEMRTYLRTLKNDRIEFTHEDPEPFAPPTSEE
ncbi:hypothetical protein NGM10_07155 [Halorussus salilacus]|uniref:DUF7529 family protein n=1 Tax=Halorussus salilacus TaxID=2953750 RepID=UPI00209E3E5B|nr:hypothetical protein [Halorussus salilacus]USZ69505.1 hypothetical protein NGM10_07155 [Halorussus salilacus]